MPSKFIVVVTAPDEFAAEQPQVVAVTPKAGLGQALLEQVQQKRGERVDYLLAHCDVRGLDVPRSGPIIEVRHCLAQALCVL